MAKTKFGVFSLSQFPDLAKVVESFDDDLGFFELAEKLGYDKVWIAEHLFSTYGLVTSTQVYAAAIAQRTKKIRIGMAVCAIPFNHPLRTASDFALVDILSHGRLDFGVGRAYQPHEFVGLGVPMDQSREMLAEGLDIVLKSWTQEKISYQRQVLDHPGAGRAAAQARAEAASARVPGDHQPGELRAGGAHRRQPADGLAIHLPHLPRDGGWMSSRRTAHTSTRCAADLDRDPKKAERMLLLPFFVHEDAKQGARDLQGARRVVLRQGDGQPACRRAADGRGQGLRAHHARRQEDARDGLPLLRQAAPVWRLHRR